MTAKRNSLGAGFSLFCLCIVLVGSPAGAKGTFTIFPSGPIPTVINDSGVVVGVDSSVAQAFIRTPDGTFTHFTAADNGSTQPASINGSGVITGYYADDKAVSHGFVRDAAGVITSFDGPGASKTPHQGTYPCHINAQGVITGWYHAPTGYARGFVRAVDGTITAFDVPATGWTWGFGINDKGVIAGAWSTDYAIYHGFIRLTTGKITTFDVPGAVYGTHVNAINSGGSITGSYLDQSYIQHAYIRKPAGTYTTYDVGSMGTTIGGEINDKGMVSGIYLVDGRGKEMSYIRYPSGVIRTISGSNSGGSTGVYGLNGQGELTGFLQNRPAHHTPYSSYGFIWTP